MSTSMQAIRIPKQKNAPRISVYLAEQRVLLGISYGPCAVAPATCEGGLWECLRSAILCLQQT